MLFTLFSLAFSHSSIDIIAELNDYTFDTYVKHRKNTSVIMVMFYSNNCPGCKQAAPVFVEAAGLSYGMVQYARANTQNTTHVCQDYHITNVPTFLVFYPGGYKQYIPKDQTAKKMVAFTDRFIPKLAQKVDECWLPTNEENCMENAAILFSAKKNTPPMWNAISAHYNETFLPIGFCNNENITKDFNVTDVPAIGFLHNKTFKQYEGNKTFIDLFKAIKTEFPELARPRPTPTPVPTPSDHVTNPGVWEATCKKKKYCVIEAKPDTTKEFIDFAQQYFTEPFKFISCGETCPWPEMTDGFWIFHTKLDRAMYAPDYEELRLHIQRFLAGSPKWTNREELLKQVAEMHKANSTSTNSTSDSTSSEL